MSESAQSLILNLDDDSSDVPAAALETRHKELSSLVGATNKCELSPRPIKTFSWDPCGIFSENPRIQFALVILNRELQLPFSVYSTLWANAVYKVAADGGADRLYDLNKLQFSTKTSTSTTITTAAAASFLHLDCIVGDLDSLQPKSRAYWVKQKVPIIQDPDQNSTDFAKAVYHIRNRQGKNSKKPLDIVVLGDLSGRIDHAMSLLHHLYTLQEQKEGEKEKRETGDHAGRLYLLSSEAITFMLQAGIHEVIVRKKNQESNQSFNYKNDSNKSVVRIKKHVGIIPLKEPSIISTSGLEWDVSNWETKFGGQISTSNHTRSDVISIQTSKDIIITLDLEILSPEERAEVLKST
ncbi:thiamine pyrophosphokinase 1 [Erysiphe neolycopersici]|uniref:Thiamine pyrophosphokinase 1 n=1 Tax=Erysiphe neolycopersici TaxID=212602 RepID=A0A420HM39_9PEZI|nr:thiamine pyrophosphokinase 1 [Erysiphe neolycopersici]